MTEPETPAPPQVITRYASYDWRDLRTVAWFPDGENPGEPTDDDKADAIAHATENGRMFASDLHFGGYDNWLAQYGPDAPPADS